MDVLGGVFIGGFGEGVGEGVRRGYQRLGMAWNGADCAWDLGNLNSPSCRFLRSGLWVRGSHGKRGVVVGWIKVKWTWRNYYVKFLTNVGILLVLHTNVGTRPCTANASSIRLLRYSVPVARRALAGDEADEMGVIHDQVQIFVV